MFDFGRFLEDVGFVKKKDKLTPTMTWREAQMIAKIVNLWGGGFNYKPFVKPEEVLFLQPAYTEGDKKVFLFRDGPVQIEAFIWNGKAYSIPRFVDVE